MPFEVRPANPVDDALGDPRVSVYADDEWRRLLALARRHGFDPEDEYADAMSPEPGEEGVLGIAAAQSLAVALSEALREETELGGEGEVGILVGPPDQPDLQVEWARVRGLGEVAESGSIKVVHSR